MDNLFTAEGIKIVAAEALAHLQDALVVKNLCATDLGAEYNIRPNGYSVGEDISFKINPVYEAKSFDPTTGVEVQPIRSSNRTMTIEEHLDVTVNVTARDKALSFDGFSEEVIAPGAHALAEKVDQYIASKVYGAAGMYASADLFGSVSGVGGKDLAQARKAALLQQLGKDRFCLLNPDLEATLLGQTWFTGADNRGDDSSLTNGYLKRTMGMDFYSSVNWDERSHTQGSGAGTLVDAATASANGFNKVADKALVFTEITAAFAEGDRIKIAGLKRPMIVAANKAVALSTASVADRTVMVVDPITEIVKGDSAVTTISAGKDIDWQGAIFDGQSLGVAMPMLDPAEGQPSYVVSSNGVSVRVVLGYDTKFKKTQLSMDCLIGGFALDPRRITLLGSHA